MHMTCLVSSIAGIGTMIKMPNLEWKDDILQPTKCMGHLNFLIIRD